MEQNYQPATVQSYRAELDSKILPALGHLKLSQIKPHVINSFLLSMTKDGARKDGKPGAYSRSSIQKTRNVLSSALRTATEWEILQRNPCEHVRPKGENAAEKIRFFTPAQASAFLAYLEKPYQVHISGHSRTDDTGERYVVKDYVTTKMVSEQLVVLFYLAIYTGLRKGELLALQWQDISFESDMIHVTKTVTIANGQQIVKKPKTQKSIRSVSIPHQLTIRLQHLRASQSELRLSLGSKWEGDGYVFIQETGRMMNISTPYESLQKVLKRYNAGKAEDEKLPIIPFHGLRHTSATLLAASRQDVKTVSERLGHAQVSTTLNYYVHAFEENDKKAAVAIEKVLSKQA